MVWYVVVLMIFLPWVLWVFFVAAMHIARVEREYGLTRPQKMFGKPLVWITWALSVLFNYTIAIPLSRFDAPREATFSDRLNRYREQPKWDGSKNERMAIWIQEDLLADFDETGYHGQKGR